MKPEFKLKIIFDYYVELTHFLKAYSEENASKLNNSILTKLNHEWNKENLLQCLKSTWACEKAKKEIESHFYMEINQNNIELIEKKLKSNKKFSIFLSNYFQLCLAQKNLSITN